MVRSGRSLVLNCPRSSCPKFSRHIIAAEKVDADGILPLQKEGYKISAAFFSRCDIRISECMNTIHKVEWYRAGQQSFVSTYLRVCQERRAFFVTRKPILKKQEGTQ